MSIATGRMELRLQSLESGAVETLRSGQRFKIRPVRPADSGALIDALSRSSERSLYRRFFSPKRGLTDAEIKHFMDLDLVRHLALVAVIEEDNQEVVMAGARYIVAGPGTAEVAFLVVDAYQGLGIGQALMRHLIKFGREAGLRELVAEVLTDNIAMLRVFDRCGLPVSKKSGTGVVHIAMQLA
jgi:RimJ/RimL family protein N-acetyltransferase